MKYFGLEIFVIYWIPLSSQVHFSMHLGQIKLVYIMVIMSAVHNQVHGPVQSPGFTVSPCSQIRSRANITGNLCYYIIELLIFAEHDGDCMDACLPGRPFMITYYMYVAWNTVYYSSGDPVTLVKARPTQMNFIKTSSNSNILTC